MATGCAFFKVRAEWLNIIYTNLGSKRVNMFEIKVKSIFESKEMEEQKKIIWKKSFTICAIHAILLCVPKE
jgi:hypothetical protein